MKHLIFLTPILLSSQLQAATLYSWTASSGLLPDQVAPSIPGSTVTLTDTSPSDPVITGGALTISTSTATQSQSMSYRINMGALVDNPTLLENGFAITATIQIDTGSQFDRRRAPAGITANIGGSIKSAHFGTTFAALTTDFEFPFPNITTANTGAFNIFRLEYDGQVIGSAMRLYKNGALILSSNTGDQTGSNSEDITFGFGESSTIAGGTSQWQSLRIETIPEPSSTLLTLVASACLLRRKRLT